MLSTPVLDYKHSANQTIKARAAAHVAAASRKSSLNSGTSAADRALSARIRREIMAREDLSIDAQNVKIITINGQVTLRGPVQNLTEEQTIIQIARNAVTQDAKVTNQIQTISPPPKNNGILPPNGSN